MYPFSELFISGFLLVWNHLNTHLTNVLDMVIYPLLHIFENIYITLVDMHVLSLSALYVFCLY